MSRNSRLCRETSRHQREFHRPGGESVLATALDKATRCVKPLSRLLRGSERDPGHILSPHERPAPLSRRRIDRRGTARSRARPDRVVRPRALRHRGPDPPRAGHLGRDRGGPLAARRRPARPHPAVERRRRRGGVRPRPPGAGALGADLAGRAGRDAAPAARPGARPPGRDHRPHRVGVRQGPQARVRRAAAHRADGPLLRPHRPPAPRHPAQARRRPRPHPGRGQPDPQGRRRDHLAVELPVHDGAVRRAARAARRQRRRRQAGRPDHAVGAAGRRAARAGRLPRGPVAGRRGPRSRRSVRRSSAAPTTSASPARRPPAGSSRRAAPTG